MTFRSFLILLAVAVSAACPKDPGQVVDPANVHKNCEASSECPTGDICSQGNCVIGTCDPVIETDCDNGTVADSEQSFCCKPWELCNGVDFQCRNDPSVHGIGCDQNDPGCTPCETQEDCAAGQFCSGAACFNAAGREDCTSSFQCNSGERCDRNVFLCVPDRGGCTFCQDFPELCCEAGQACSQESGFCVDVGEPECENPGVQDSCANGLFCNDNRQCVQCVTDADCGPGLACDGGTGHCFSLIDQCQSDGDCSGNKRCSVEAQTCVIPQCTSDATCHSEDARELCNLSSFECFLPPAECDETDEPNNSTAAATPMTDGVSYAGTLCRGDTDVLSFPVIPHKRYTATVDFHGSGQPGIGVQMLNTTLAIESFQTFTTTQASVQVTGVTGDSETGNFYIKVEGANQARDSWTYSVTIREDEPSQTADCSAAGQPEEPNDDFATATPLTIGETKTFSRCGTDDVDFYSIPLSPLHSVKLILGGFFNAEGNLNVDLFDGASTSDRVSGAGGNTVNDFEQVTGPEGPGTYFVKVALATVNGAVQNQTYNVTATEVPRPGFCATVADCPSDALGNPADACTAGVCTLGGAPLGACVPNPTEDDGTVVNAAALTLVADNSGGDPDHNLGVFLADGKAADGTADATAVGPLRCNPQDIDLFTFTMPPNLQGSALIRFNQSEGNMALDLLDASGNQIATSNSSSTSNPVEQVAIPGSTQAESYVVRARLSGSSGGITGQHYALEVHTFDAAQCIATEPDGGDDSFATARCVGAVGDYAGSGFPCASFVPEPLAPADCSTAASGTAGCGRTCGNDDKDFYRVGALAREQTVHARLEFDPAQGDLSVVRSSATLGTATSSDNRTENDTDSDGIIDVFFTELSTTQHEFAFRVNPRGTTGHQLQPYTFNLEVGAACTDDDNDAGTASNNLPSTSTFVPSLPASLAESLCTTNDVDVYEVILGASQTLRVQIDQDDHTPSGMEAELYARPENAGILPDLADALAIAVDNGGPVTFQSTEPAASTFYVVVRTADGTPVTGPYTLSLQ